jgi:hypothetical protein
VTKGLEQADYRSLLVVTTAEPIGEFIYVIGGDTPAESPTCDFCAYVLFKHIYLL